MTHSAEGRAHNKSISAELGLLFPTLLIPLLCKDTWNNSARTLHCYTSLTEPCLFPFCQHHLFLQRKQQVQTGYKQGCVLNEIPPSIPLKKNTKELCLHFPLFFCTPVFIKPALIWEMSLLRTEHFFFVTALLPLVFLTQSRESFLFFPN